MNKILFLFLLVVSLHPYAQNNECLERLLSKQGSWGKSYTTNNATASDAVIQKKFLDAAHQMIRPYYNPMSVVTNEYFSYAPQRSAEPVNHYLYSIMAFNYVCKGEIFSVNEETSTRLDIKFNSFSETPLYDTTDDYQLTGYFDLRHGLPMEIKPGIWQFPDDPEPLGFGRTGNSKLWLISFDGKVPWSYVTRREFLLKRKQNLLHQLKDEEPRLKEQLGKWEVEKKYKEEEWKNDATRLTNYINVTYKPGIDREQQNYKRSKEALEKAIEKVEEQLSAPETDLNKPAIVIRSSKNHLDYEFTDKVEPFAEVLTKPNPAYFNRSLQRSVPQFICIEIIYDHLDSIATRFARSVNDLIDLDYLKSFIGKTAPGNWSGKPARKTTAQTITPGKTKIENNVVQAVNKITGNNNSKAISNVSSQTKTAGKAYTVSVTLSAPTGTLATINCNGSDLSVSVLKGNKISYNTAPFHLQNLSQKMLLMK
jgi:hypothetical protein